MVVHPKLEQIIQRLNGEYTSEIEAFNRLAQANVSCGKICEDNFETFDAKSFWEVYARNVELASTADVDNLEELQRGVKNIISHLSRMLNDVDKEAEVHARISKPMNLFGGTSTTD